MGSVCGLEPGRMNIRVDCSAALARRLMSNPDASTWGAFHAFKVVSREVGEYVGHWPMVYEHAKTEEPKRKRNA